VRGIRTSLGIELRAKSVVLTNGTFLGKIHIGEKQFGGGLKSAAYGITEDLINAGFESGRMKTGRLKSGWTFFGFFENERRKRRCQTR
jgi:tRNA uridine 5-carboxymethylaminomethyl modification enzyme